MGAMLLEGLLESLDIIRAVIKSSGIGRNLQPNP